MENLCEHIICFDLKICFTHSWSAFAHKYYGQQNVGLNKDMEGGDETVHFQSLDLLIELNSQLVQRDVIHLEERIPFFFS